MTERDLKSWAGVTEDGEGRTLAVVFTDIIDSTKLAVDVGNAMMFSLLRTHFEQARRLCHLHRGLEIKLIGDGYLAAFPTTADALQFALKFREKLGTREFAFGSASMLARYGFGKTIFMV